METATFGGGCFWCAEAIFQRLKGVSSVVPGYSGGDTKNPTYDEVCEGNTGHVESIEIKFDPNIIPFEKLLEIFFYTHDPTTPNQQGNDIGPQYQSSVFYHSEEQKIKTLELIKKLEEDKIYTKPIVTEVKEFKKFYEAEDYHKNYFERNRDAAYCNYVIGPKIHKLIERYGKDIKKEYEE